MNLALGVCPSDIDTARDLLSQIEQLYASGMTQREIAVSIGVSQKVVFGTMRRLGIKARRSFPRQQRRDKNKNWKGGNAGVSALHKRVESLRGKPRHCEVCEISGGKWVIYEWANLSGNYSNPEDYKRMCRSCHRRHDKGHLNLAGAKGGCKPRKEVHDA